MNPEMYVEDILGCSYLAGDERAKCFKNHGVIYDKKCAECKMQWLFDEVDE